MIDTRENFWRLEPTVYGSDGEFTIACGDCPWTSAPLGLIESVSEAYSLLGVHYLHTDRHTVIDEEALSDA